LLGAVIVKPAHYGLAFSLTPDPWSLTPDD
jgi:hypothetical protein